MSDAADLAGPLEQRERDHALARQAIVNAAYEAPFEVKGRRVCLDCFDPIYKMRLKANPHAVRCMGCQQDHDRRKKRGIA